MCAIIGGVKRFLRLFLFLCAAAFAGGPAGAEPLRVRDVLAMEGAALDGSNPCTVTARVTFVMSWLPGSVIVTDPRAPDGPAVYATDRLYGPILAQGFENLRAGDLVEMTAHPVAMQLEPGLYVTAVRLLAHAELPPPQVVSAAAIVTGRHSNRRVRVRAVVISVRVEGPLGNRLTLVSLATEAGRITARVRGDHPELAYLRDAEVEVSGLAMPVFNPRAEFCYAEIETIDGASSIVIRKEPPKSPFDVPDRTGTGVLGWQPDDGGLHAVRIAGEVTYVRPDEGYFIVQHGKTAVRVAHEGGDLPALGASLEVAGFPMMQGDAGMLADAVYRPAADAAAPVEPYRLRLSEADLQKIDLSEHGSDFTYRLVTVEGRVLRVSSSPGAPLRLAMDVDGETVDVEAPPGLAEKLAAQLEDLPIVRVRGVLDTRIVRNLVFTRFFLFSHFTVLPRDGADFEIVPDFAWRLRRALRYGRHFLLLLVLALLAALAVVLVRRQRDRDRQAIVAADRKRIAGELHDTIAQHISAAKLWVFAAKTAAGEALPGPAGDALNMAAGVLEATRAEIRNAIMDLQSDEFLSSSPAEMLRRLARASDIPGRVRVRTSLRGLPSEMPVGPKRDLLALVQEALTNAVRHGGARNVIIVSEGDGTAFTLEVLNDGAPFDAASAPGPETGHFGLSNMRERAVRAQLALTFGEHRGYRAVTLERKRT